MQCINNVLTRKWFIQMERRLNEQVAGNTLIPVTRIVIEHAVCVTLPEPVLATLIVKNACSEQAMVPDVPIFYGCRELYGYFSDGRHQA